jgi:hypothetical protein
VKGERGIGAKGGAEELPRSICRWGACLEKIVDSKHCAACNRLTFARGMPHSPAVNAFRSLNRCPAPDWRGTYPHA